MNRKIVLALLLGLLLLGLCGCDSTPQATPEPTAAPTPDKYGESSFYLVSAKVFDMPEGVDYLTYDPGFEKERVNMIDAVSYSEAEAYAMAAPGEGAVIMWEFDSYSSKYKNKFAQSDFEPDDFCLDLVKSFTIGLEDLGEAYFYSKPLYYYSGDADAQTGEIKGVIAYTVLGNTEILREHDLKIYTSSKDFEIKAEDMDTSGLTISDTGRLATLRAILNEYGIETYTYFKSFDSRKPGLGLDFSDPFEEVLKGVLCSGKLGQTEDKEMLAARLILETDSFSLIAAELENLPKDGLIRYPFRFLEVALYCLKEGVLANNEEALAIVNNQYSKLALPSGGYVLAELAQGLRLLESSPEKYARFFPDVNEWGESTLLTQSFLASLPEEMKSPLRAIPLYIVMRNPSGIYSEADLAPNKDGRFVPAEPMKGGFILSTVTKGHPGAWMNRTDFSQYDDYYRAARSTLFCPLDIQNAQLMIQETLTYKSRGPYQASGGGTVTVYTYDWQVTVTDAVTSEVLYTDSLEGSSQESYTVPVGTKDYYVPAQILRSNGIQSLVDALLEKGII